ncbi:MAG: mechanosensitive ion channel family protein [Candidatus Aenigmatarchaeota archaeon]
MFDCNIFEKLISINFSFSITEYLPIIITSLIIIIITFIVYLIFRKIIIKSIAMINKSIAYRIDLIGSIIIWIISFIILFKEFGIDFSSSIIIYSALILGLIISLRDVLSNIFAYFMINSSDIIRVGEVIKINEYNGKVVKINSLYTTIITHDYVVVNIPNNLLLHNIIENESRPGILLISIPIEIDPSKIDINEAKLIMLKSSEIAKTDLAPEKVPEVRVLRISSDRVILELRLYILNPAKKEAIEALLKDKIYQKIESLRK